MLWEIIVGVALLLAHVLTTILVGKHLSKVARKEVLNAAETVKTAIVPVLGSLFGNNNHSEKEKEHV